MPIKLQLIYLSHDLSKNKSMPLRHKDSKFHKKISSCFFVTSRLCGKSCSALRILFFLTLCFTGNVFSQDSLSFFSPAKELNKKRVTEVIGLQAVGYGGSLIGLSAAWYSGYSHTSFHSFDDSKEWLQMDKAGHFLTSWYLGRIGSDIYEWTGMKKKKAVLLGALSGWGYLTGIEMLDGFSDGWGFSWSDFSANTLGSGLIIGQKFLRDHYSPLAQGVKGLSLKFSFHQTDYPSFRPALLGKNLNEQILKDYNGQTYWLSMNIASFFRSSSSYTTFRDGREKSHLSFPRWLNLAFGYGGEGMISGKDELVTLANGNQVWMERYRQYYLSLDIDLTRIKTKSKFLHALAETFCFIKIPAPAIEFSKHGVKGYAFYY